MKILDTELPGVKLIEPKTFIDDRGFFLETYNQDRYREVGIDLPFVQDNLSYSHKHVLRGLHFQQPYGQGKLAYVLQGEVLDVVVDVRRASPTFGRWIAMVLSCENQRQIYVPPGFAHGFCVISDTALFAYKCTDLYHPEAERTVLWCDPDLGIPWPTTDPILSAKDGCAARLNDLFLEES